MEYKTKKEQLAAVKKYGYAIKHIENPDKGVQLAAVKKYGSAIEYIKNPDKDVQMTAIKDVDLNKYPRYKKYFDEEFVVENGI